VGPVTQPTPEEAAAALRAVQESQDQLVRNAATARGRWPWIAGGVFVFAYCTATDLFPTASPWLSWVLVVVMVGMVVMLRSRVGSAWLGQPVRVSRRAVSLRRRVLRMVVVLGAAVAVSITILLLHVPHGQILYGTLAALYIIFFGPRFQAWLLTRPGRA
jgi:hypothetical protein